MEKEYETFGNTIAIDNDTRRGIGPELYCGK